VEISSRHLAAAAWYRDFAARNNETFLPLIFDRHRYLVLKGGGGSGKSIFAGEKVLARATTEAGHRILVCRKVARTLRESCFEQLRGQISELYPHAGASVNKSDMAISFANGSKIIFAGLDDVEKLKSIYDITMIWIEEASEILESDFNQLDIRLRTETPYYKQIILTFNPISVTHWLKKRFFDFDIADPAEREKAMARTRVHESTYKDNRFLPAESRETLEAFRYTDEYYYTVYCLGQWGVTGKTVFDAAAVTRRLAELTEPIAEGHFEYDYDGLKISNIRFVPQKSGIIRIYKQPEKGRPYVIGGDTAGEGSDQFVGQVLDNITTEQVCVLRHAFDEDVYARQMYCLGKYYNDALIGIEANFSSYPVKELERLGYSRQYVREREDNYTGALAPAFGFKTTPVTRPVIIGGLVQAVRGNESLLHDRTTLEEMLTFVRNEKLRPEAEEGAHDDCVLALAIAHYIRPQQSMQVYSRAAEWTQDMWDDYNRATAEERDLLIRLWGEPERK